MNRMDKIKIANEKREREREREKERKGKNRSIIDGVMTTTAIFTCVMFVCVKP